MDTEAPPLLDTVDEFIERHAMSAVTFGRAALRDPHFVRDLRAGRRVWPETESKVRHFMVTYRAPAPAEAA